MSSTTEEVIKEIFTLIRPGVDREALKRALDKVDGDVLQQDKCFGIPICHEIVHQCPEHLDLVFNHPIYRELIDSNEYTNKRGCSVVEYIAMRKRTHPHKRFNECTDHIQPHDNDDMRFVECGGDVCGVPRCMDRYVVE